MQRSRYALVAYTNDPVAEFIRQLRRELHPDLPLLPAHLTVIPPRFLPGDVAPAIEAVAEICSHVEPFEVNLGEVETFIPVTPTVFIRVAHAYQVRQLHDHLTAHRSLATEEEWPYLPHVTIVKMSTEEQAQTAYLLARRRWTEFECSRCIHIQELTFVREAEQNLWVDVAGVPLGTGIVSPHED
jgi:2'-5' RNA ligase